MRLIIRIISLPKCFVVVDYCNKQVFSTKNYQHQPAILFTDNRVGGNVNITYQFFARNPGEGHSLLTNASSEEISVSGIVQTFRYLSINSPLRNIYF